MPALIFITVRLTDREKIARQVNPFYIWNTLDAIAGKMKSPSQLNCILLVEAYSKNQLESILKAQFGSCCLYPVGSLLFHLVL
jgi:hypothetical protein